MVHNNFRLIKKSTPYDCVFPFHSWHVSCKITRCQLSTALHRAGAWHGNPIHNRRIYMSAKDVLKTISENEVKFVDFRFTDSRGKEHHVSVPVSQIDENTFVDGKMFDGSSIDGWKGINESDMILMPDTSTAFMDPFCEEATLNISCDVIEPATMQGYERDPRSIAKRGEAYLKSTGIGDTAYFGPENEFFVFDSIAWNYDVGSAFYKINSEHGSSPAPKRRLFPGSPG